MNALTRASLSALPRATAGRTMATRATIDAIKANNSGKKVWLSDPSTYPVLATCLAACGVCFTYGSYKIFYCNDVQWDKNKRGSVIRWWGAKDAPVKLN